MVGFWPVKCTKDRKNLVARFPGTAEESVPFPFGVQFEGFSKIDNDVILYKIFENNFKFINLVDWNTRSIITVGIVASYPC